MPLHRVVQQSRINSLDIVTAGPEVPNPAELLSSPRLAELLDEARKSYDIILVDSSPLLAVTDPAIIGAVADGIILTVRAWTLDHHDAEQSVELLRNLGTPILGLLVNGIDPRRVRLRRSIPLQWARIRPRFGIERGRGSHSGDPGPVAAPAQWSDRNPARTMSSPWRRKHPVNLRAQDSLEAPHEEPPRVEAAAVLTDLVTTILIGTPTVRLT